MRTLLAAATVAVFASAAFALRPGPVAMRTGLPDHTLTPGVIDPRVTQANIRSTICVPGYTKKVRPPESYTERLKRRQIAQYGYSDRRLRNYEEDHLISLELGGSPSDPKNLWPEPHHVPGHRGSYDKDQLENRLHQMVCRGEMSLHDAQQWIATDWVAAERTVRPEK